MMLYNLCIHYWILGIYFYSQNIWNSKFWAQIYDLKSFLKNFFEKWQTTRKEELFLSVFITFHDIRFSKKYNVTICDTVKARSTLRESIFDSV